VVFLPFLAVSVTARSKALEAMFTGGPLRSPTQVMPGTGTLTTITVMYTVANSLPSGLGCLYAACGIEFIKNLFDLILLFLKFE
jgi:hypothetical protein